MRKATEIQHDLRTLSLRNMGGVATELFYKTEDNVIQKDKKCIAYFILNKFLENFSRPHISKRVKIIFVLLKKYKFKGLNQ